MIIFCFPVGIKTSHPMAIQAEPLIESLALHKLADPRLEESYDTYELYHMARAAYLCVQSNPDLRPSMGEVILHSSFDYLSFMHVF